MGKGRRFSPRNLKLNMQNFCNAEDTVVNLKGIYPANKYANDVKTDEIIGYKYLVELPHNEELYLYVKILGAPLVTREDIVSAGKLRVKFEGLECKFYTNANGYPDLSVTATGLTIVKEDM